MQDPLQSINENEDLSSIDERSLLLSDIVSIDDFDVDQVSLGGESSCSRYFEDMIELSLLLDDDANPIRIEENNIKNLTKSAVVRVASWILIRNSSKEPVSKSQLSRASQVIPNKMHIQVHLNGLYAGPQVSKGPQVSSGTNQLLNVSA